MHFLQIQRDSEAAPGATTRAVILRGEPDRLEKAKALINEMIEERYDAKSHTSRPNLVHTVIIIGNKHGL